MKRLLLPFFIVCSAAVTAQTVSLGSSNLPIIVINTNGQTILDDPKITADMGIVFNPAGARNNVSDPFNHYSGKIGIEYRGQSSQSFPMKSFSIELRDKNGASQDKSLFGMPKESDWVLYAPYLDKTLMRNFLAYNLSSEMGHWAAHCRYVELVLDGSYQGIYVFMEKIKRGSGRVPITKMDATDTSGDAVTGGYIFSLDKGANAWYSPYLFPGSKAGKPRFSYVYPKPDNIVPAQQNYLKSYVDSFETALYGSNYQDVARGVRRFADLSSFTDMFIVNEVSRNVDGYRLSTYLYKDRNSRDSRIHAGPVWDYDLSFRNANYCDGSLTSGWAWDFNSVCPGDDWVVPFWWNKLMTDTAFTAGLRCRWKTLRATSLSEARLSFLIDSIAALTAEARTRHYQKWPTLGVYIWPNPQPIPQSYAGEMAALKAWIHDRLTWIDANLPNNGACYDYPADKPGNIIVELYPNPVNAATAVQVQSRFNQQATLRVIDAMGREIMHSRYALSFGRNRIPINATGWAAGVYFVHLQTDNGDRVIKSILRP